MREDTDLALTRFVTETMTPALRATLTLPQHLAELRRIGAEIRNAQRLRIVPEGEHSASIVLEEGDSRVVRLTVAATAPNRIETLTAGR